MARLIALFAALAGCNAQNATGKLFKSYVVDWAHYRSGDYKWGAADLAPVSETGHTRATFFFAYTNIHCSQPISRSPSGLMWRSFRSFTSAPQLARNQCHIGHIIRTASAIHPQNTS